MFNPWFWFSQSIKRKSWLIFGVLNSPLSKLTSLLSPFTGETVNTQALSLGLYAM